MNPGKVYSCLAIVCLEVIIVANIFRLKRKHQDRQNKNFAIASVTADTIVCSVLVNVLNTFHVMSDFGQHSKQKFLVQCIQQKHGTNSIRPRKSSEERRKS
jgi:hypothetical protein